MTGLRPFEGIIPLAQSFGAFSAAADVLSIGLGLHLPSGQLQLAVRLVPEKQSFYCRRHVLEKAGARLNGMRELCARRPGSNASCFNVYGAPSHKRNPANIASSSRTSRPGGIRFQTRLPAHLGEQ